MSIARYCTLQFQPHPNRTEHVNYGIVAFLPQGGVRVHIASGLRKVKALSPSVDLDSLRTQEAELPRLLGNADLASALSLLNAMRVLRNQLQDDLGSFSFSSEAEYTRQVRLALNAQCETATGHGQPREQRSRLFRDVRDRFSTLGILAKEQAAIPDHQVVEHYTPDPDADVKVEFALQNGILRVAQTIDLRTDARSLVSSAHKQSAYSKAYAIHYAKTALEQSSMESYVIVAGAHTEAAEKVMTAIKADADHVLEWENRDHMNEFFGKWAEAAGRPLPTMPMH